MISDTLSEAAAELRRYLREFPNTYGPWRREIDTLLARMDKLRADLNRVPSSEKRSAKR